MKSPVKQVAAIHDLSGFGRASLTVVIPILSTMGIQVCPLPTAVLSTHSKFKGFHFVDLTDQLEDLIEHWKELNLQFDAIYSGFLGSHEQTQIVSRFISDFKKDNQIVVIDPVLGDNGKIYTPLNLKMVEEMKDLVTCADIITPNITEASLLLDKEYKTDISLDELKDWLRLLADKGPETVIATSVPEGQSNKKSSVIAYTKKNNRFWKVSVDYLPANFPGTGDTFASVIVGSLLQGDSLPIAMDRAAGFTSDGVRATFGYDYNPDHGILLERILPNLLSPIHNSKYEILE